MLASLRHSPGPALRRRVTTVVGLLLLSVGVANQPAHADDSVAVETASAISITMDYWASAMPNQFYVQWAPPAVSDWGYGYNSLYDGTSTPIYCGDTLLESDNSYACESDYDNWVAFDATFMNRSLELGDTFVYVIVAHEFGHVVQAQLADDQIWNAPELQADCFAGSSMAGMVNDGTLLLDDADYDEIDATFQSIGSNPWAEGDEHGSAEERTAAFNLGWNGGGDSRVCLPSN